MKEEYISNDYQDPVVTDQIEQPPHLNDDPDDIPFVENSETMEGDPKSPDLDDLTHHPNLRH